MFFMTSILTGKVILGREFPNKSWIQDGMAFDSVDISTYTAYSYHNQNARKRTSVLQKESAKRNHLKMKKSNWLDQVVLYSVVLF